MQGIVTHADGSFSGAKAASLAANLQAAGALVLSLTQPDLITPNVLILVGMILLFSYFTRASARKATPAASPAAANNTKRRPAAV